MSSIGSAFPNALSGLQAATKRVVGAANNIANLNDVTALSPKAGDPPQFQPLLTTQTALASGGTVAQFQNVTPASVPSFQPDSPFANADGLVAVPNVDLATEMIDSMTASTSYKANLKVIEVARQMQDQLLKIKA
jgi:flagellar basal-body rod protein FlgC